MSRVPLEEVGNGIYRTTHDVTDGGLSVTIAQALAEIEDVTPAEVINDFSTYVDPDAFDRLFRVRDGDDQRHASGHVYIEIEGVAVTVQANGQITIEE